MTDLMTIAEAADSLGCKPGDVDRMIGQGRLRAATLVDAASVAEVSGTPIKWRERAETAEAKLARIEEQWRAMVRPTFREELEAQP